MECINQLFIKCDKKSSIAVFGSLMSMLIIPNVHAIPFVDISLGSVFTNPGRTQTVRMDPSYWKTLIADNKQNSVLYGGLSAGLRRALTPLWQLELIGSYYRTAKISQTGTIYQYDNPDFYNLNYEYFIQNQRIMGVVKLLTVINTTYHPYIAAGLGASFNKSYRYHERSIEPYALPDSPFASHSRTNFSYSGAVGLELDVNTKWRVGAGYEFSYLGRASLNAAATQTVAQYVISKKIEANQFLIHASCIV